ncbi:MAG: hypothetical protein WKI04_13010 [Ferruginibacter sp.]
MLKNFILLISVYIFSSIPASYGQDIFNGYEKLFTPPRQYIAYRSGGHIRVDGKLAEASWGAAPWSATLPI